MFFHPEFIDAKYKQSIDEAIDKSIQTSPIDVRRKLYAVNQLAIRRT
jgi:actin-related protein 3